MARGPRDRRLHRLTRDSVRSPRAAITREVIFPQRLLSTLAYIPRGVQFRGRFECQTGQRIDELELTHRLGRIRPHLGGRILLQCHDQAGNHVGAGSRVHIVQFHNRSPAFLLVRVGLHSLDQPFHLGFALGLLGEDGQRPGTRPACEGECEDGRQEQPGADHG